MRALLCLASLCGASCIQEAAAADFIESCPVLGGDAGNNIIVSDVTPNAQFMVSTGYQVNYRVCKPLLADGGPPCVATSTDAPIAANAQVDLCMPSQYGRVSFYKLYDGGNPAVCHYLVTPKTVCQINSSP